MIQTELTIEQKLTALSYKYYSFVEWKPKKGDYYTTSRDDTQLYIIIDEDEENFITQFCTSKVGEDTDKWEKSKFLEDFGLCRVHVPNWILEQV